jgi:sugar/nucleoside kinase (ribokinase family)
MHHRKELLALIERAARGEMPPEPQFSANGESLDGGGDDAGLGLIEPTPPRRSFSAPQRPVSDLAIPRVNRLARGDSLSGRGSSVRFEMPFVAEEHSSCPACGQPVARLPSPSRRSMSGWNEASEDDEVTPMPIVGAAGDARCVVFGSINMDMTARAQCWWPEVPHASTMGELQQSPGGKGANEAVALARLGVSTSLVGRLGNDEHARFLLAHFAQERVDTSGIQQQPDGFTGTAIQIVTSKDGHKFGVSCKESNGRVGDTEVDAVVERLRRAASASARGVLLVQLELPDAPVEAAVRRASGTPGCAVAFKPSPLPPQKVATAHRILEAGVALCFVNESEAPALLAPVASGWQTLGQLQTLEDAERAAESILQCWPTLRTVIVTCPVAHVLRERLQLTRDGTKTGGGWLDGAHQRWPAGQQQETSVAAVTLVMPRAQHPGFLDAIGAADAFIGGFVAAQCAHSIEARSQAHRARGLTCGAPGPAPRAFVAGAGSARSPNRCTGRRRRARSPR